MDVAVDQAGKDGGRAQVHDPGTRHVDEAVLHRFNRLAANHDADVTARGLARFDEKRARVNDGSGLGGRLQR